MQLINIKLSIILYFWLFHIQLNCKVIKIVDDAEQAVVDYGLDVL